MAVSYGLNQYCMVSLGILLSRTISLFVIRVVFDVTASRNTYGHTGSEISLDMRDGCYHGGDR